MGEAPLKAEPAGCFPLHRYLHVGGLWEAALNSLGERRDRTRTPSAAGDASTFLESTARAASAWEAPIDLTASIRLPARRGSLRSFVQNLEIWRTAIRILLALGSADTHGACCWPVISASEKRTLQLQCSERQLRHTVIRRKTLWGYLSLPSSREIVSILWATSLLKGTCKNLENASFYQQKQGHPNPEMTTFNINSSLSPSRV